MHDAEKTARDSIRRLSNGELDAVWMASETQPMSEELARTRGWLMDELESRMGELDAQDEDLVSILTGNTTARVAEPRFDRWLFTDSDGPVSPAPFLTR